MHSGLQRCLILLLALFIMSPPPSSLAASAADVQFDMFQPASRINGSVEAVINEVLKQDRKGRKPPSMSTLAPLIEYMVMVDSSRRGTQPDKRNEGMGIFWRGTLNKPFYEALRYFYNPNIPSEILYPASLRRGHWLPGSDILKLEKPVWEMFEGLGDTPVVLSGKEFEEITPDDYSGCYYVYTLNRLLVLLRYKGVPMLLSVAWQEGRSETGMKAGFAGPYENWDFVYTDKVGGTAKGIGWMSTYMYASCSITLIFPQTDGSTCYSMLKWLKAGWSGLNVVKREHIAGGADRNFKGMLAIIDGEKGISVEELEAISKKYDAYNRPAMLAEASPYAAELAKLSKNNEILSREEFQAVLAGGKYAETLSDENLRSLLKVLALKRKLGKPVLGG